MKKTRNLHAGATLLIAISVLVAAQLALQEAATAQAGQKVQAPMFQVDPM